MKIISIIILTILTSACNSQQKEVKQNKLIESVKEETASQIGEYVTSAYRDSKENLWFGTLQKGIARFDGDQLKYFTKDDGLPSDRVTSVIEDSKGIYWFHTDQGLSKFDGEMFTNYTVKNDDFLSNLISSLFIDSRGDFWVGTWGGVFKFNGESFTPFPLPYPKVKTAINKDTKDWITEIKEDPEGNIWFSRDGFGVCKYDGEGFSHILKKDGLHSNNVTEIEFDGEGNMWFGTRVAEKDNPDPKKRKGRGGVNQLKSNKIVSFPKIEGFNDNDVYEIYAEDSGDIWISTISNGVYKYKDETFKNYKIPIAIVEMTTDEHGNLWLAGTGGLYKINENEEIINVKTNGPWK